MHISAFIGFGAYASGVSAGASQPRNIIYYDQWHTANVPPKDITSGVTHVMMSFANSSLFTMEPAGEYKPFQPLKEVRALFDHDVKVCLAVGGWGDNAGFDAGAKSDRTRERFARNVASTLDRLGFDCVDIDWEYPGGNGQDYKIIPNSKKTYEIAAFPKFLKQIKKFIGSKELSIAVPGLERDMIAYTPSQSRLINEAVDYVNVMTYDLMNRRDHYTTHHVSVAGTARAIDKYLSLGFPADKLVMGLPFYAKYFTTKKGYTCSQAIGCPTELLENPTDGSDTGKSGSMTFEKANFAVAPKNLTTTTDATCGANVFFKCAVGDCCAASGWCGSTPAHCGTGCQSAYGKCDGIDLNASFKKALKDGRTDEVNGGQWYWDAGNRIFWSWDTPELIAKKMTLLATTRGIKSVMAWALALDSYDWSHLEAMQKGFKAINAN
ncbi:chitinase [Fusarium austroafricanum]|uniref:chitinase n=1 Tax=Fusarium austroafricanum TaxID=2364996 RepID=A0A8H4K999_9HYPO|nr:chitinase [Fusarium austroafricanum]